MRIHPLLILVLASAGAGANTLLAQGLYIPAGVRVRVTPTEPKTAPTVARFVALRGDTVVVERDDREQVAVAFSDISRLETSAGTRSHALMGAALGLAAGVGIGFALGAAANDEPDCSETPFCELHEAGGTLEAFGGAIVGGVLGAAVGGVIGANVRTELWVPRHLPAHARGSVRLMPARQRVALSARIAF